MKPILFLIMGLLSTSGADCEAQSRQGGKRENPPEVGFISAKEDTRRRAELRYRPVYEVELEALEVAQTLCLVDREDVAGCYDYDTSRMISLSEAEKRIITEAYANGLFETVDFNIYDEQGNQEFISGTGIAAHGEPALPPAYYAYLFVTADKKVMLPYNHGCFRVYDISYKVSISKEWREKVDAIVKKYCPDSFSKEEMYWQGRGCGK